MWEMISIDSHFKQSMSITRKGVLKLHTNYPGVTLYLLDIYEANFGMTPVSPTSSQFWIGITVLAVRTYSARMNIKMYMQITKAVECRFQIHAKSAIPRGVFGLR